MQRTELARGTINQSDELLIELRQPDNMPATVVIVWPAAPSVASPTAFPTTASKITAHRRQRRRTARTTQGEAVVRIGRLKPLVP